MAVIKKIIIFKSFLSYFCYQLVIYTSFYIKKKDSSLMGGLKLIKRKRFLFSINCIFYLFLRVMVVDEISPKRKLAVLNLLNDHNKKPQC